MNKKKIRDVVILSSLLLVLVIAVAMQFSSGKKTAVAAKPVTASAPASVAGAATTTSAPAEKASERLSWVDPRRLPGIAMEVAYGRDPFLDVHPPVTANKNTKPTSPKDYSKISTGGPLPGPAESAWKIEQSPTVAPYTPPDPVFKLIGVVVTPAERYVTLAVDVQYYTLLEGETIPARGWTVAKIVPEYNHVILTKKNSQSITLRLSGGSPK